MAAFAKIQKLPRQPLALTAYETIVRKIICLEYPPGGHLEENQLVEELGLGPGQPTPGGGRSENQGLGYAMRH